MCEPCTHHWLLSMSTPEGTPATCKLCGEERRFRDRTAFPWEYNPKSRKIVENLPMYEPLGSRVGKRIFR